MGSKVGVLVRELERKGGEDEVEVATVLKISGTKKGCSQETIGEHTFRDGLSDGRLPCPGKAVQPEDGGCVRVFSPRLDLVQDSFTGSPEATPTISMLISSPAGTAAAIQHRYVNWMAQVSLFQEGEGLAKPVSWKQ